MSLSSTRSNKSSDNSTPQNSRWASLLCSLSVASFVGYQLYKQYVRNSAMHALDYTQYKPVLTATSPGKLILCGEHAVVYGVTAISTAIDKKTSITIFMPKTPAISPHAATLILKFNFAELRWNMFDLSQMRQAHDDITAELLASLYGKNEWITPDITLTPLQPVNPHAKLQRTEHQLLSLKQWDKQITIVFLYLFFKRQFASLWSDTFFLTHGILLELSSNIPIGVGLGSSAAWSTVLSGAIYYFYDYMVTQSRRRPLQKSATMCMSKECMQQIWNLAYEAETINHGTPSGIDNTTCLYGGYLKFKNKREFSVVNTTTTTSDEQQFVHRIPMLVINTNVVGNTKQLVANVRTLYEQCTAMIQPIWQSIEQIGQHVMQSLVDKDMSGAQLTQRINQLFAMNHGLLVAIGVGHPVIHQIQCLCAQHDFDYGFKITGAGGGGCVIVCLLSQYQQDAYHDAKGKIDHFRTLLDKHGYDSYLLQTGQAGLCCKFHYSLNIK